MLFETCFAVGMTALVASLIVSGHGDHMHDFHGHDGSAGHSHGHGHDHHSPSIFNIRFLSACVAGFGAGGYGAQVLGYGYLVSITTALVTAITLVYVLYRMARVLYRQQASSTVTAHDLIGSCGIITIAIPEKGAGEVSVLVKGATQNLLARSENGRAIPLNATVTVEDVTVDHVLVAIDQ